jgi:hypothetical protein
MAKLALYTRAAKFIGQSTSVRQFGFFFEDGKPIQVTKVRPMPLIVSGGEVVGLEVQEP